MTTSIYSTEHQRRSERIYCAYPLVVRATAANGQRLKIDTTTDNISSSGLFMHLPYLLAHGSPLFAFIRLPSWVGLAVVGRVVRTENKAQELTGTAVCFKQTRLLQLTM